MKKSEIIYVNKWGQLCSQIEQNSNKHFMLDKSLVDMAWLDSDGVVLSPNNKGIIITAFVNGMNVELHVANYLEKGDLELVGYTKNDVNMKVGDERSDTIILTNQLQRVYDRDYSLIDGEEPNA